MNYREVNTNINILGNVSVIEGTSVDVEWTASNADECVALGVTWDANDGFSFTAVIGDAGTHQIICVRSTYVLGALGS